MAPVGNQNNGGSLQPANEQARSWFQQELLVPDLMSPSQWLPLFTSKRQGEGGLVLVVSRGRSLVDKGMPSCSSDLARTETESGPV